MTELRNRNAVKATLNHRLAMRDGVELATHIYLPNGDGSFPVLLVRTPYEAICDGVSALEWPGRGFALVRQDVRGRFLSDGEFSLQAEADDGEDTLGWLAEQPWCNGNVAMYGGSYLSMTQMAAAGTGHPILKCITPCLIGEKHYHKSYWGGAFRLANKERELPLLNEVGSQAQNQEAVLTHPHYDDYWKSFCVSQRYREVSAAAFLRTGWFDIFCCDAFNLFNGLRSRRAEHVQADTRMLIGPWPHEINKKLEGWDFGPNAKVADLYEQEIAYIRRFTGESVDEELPVAPIRMFVMGINEWRDEYEWPLARTVWTDCFLAGSGSANSAEGGGRLAGAPKGAPDCFTYDPGSPVPTKGGAWGMANIGPFDQTEVEKRDDVLVYTGDVLEDNLEVTGVVTVKLFASSSATDTDFTAKLVDIHPDGKAMSVTDGIIRARYRGQDGTERVLEPGTAYEFTITCFPTSHVFLTGHRLCLEISSSNYPAFSRNLNTGNDIATDTEMVIAEQTIYHDEVYPSRLVLPIIPKE